MLMTDDHHHRSVINNKNNNPDNSLPLSKFLFRFPPSPSPLFIFRAAGQNASAMHFPLPFHHHHRRNHHPSHGPQGTTMESRPFGKFRKPRDTYRREIRRFRRRTPSLRCSKLAGNVRRNLALPVGPLSTANGTLLPALTGQITRTDTELCGGRFCFKYQYGVVCGGGGGGLTASGPCGKVCSSCQK